MPAANSSAREQNRVHTGAAIHETTYRLAKSNGLHETSIDDIAKAAGVSRRTFFNYYASKEHALFGLMHPILPDTAIVAFQESSEPLLLRCVYLIHAVYAASVAKGSTHARRKALLDHYKVDVRKGLETYMPELVRLVEPIVADTHDGNANDTALCLTVAGAILRHVHRTNATMDETTLQNAIKTIHIITEGTVNER